jgi:DNA-binding XRE family transcriptional regulator/predicted GIY-YIG superfamily endonuclease
MSSAAYTVYRLYDAERNLLYVGCTKDLAVRLKIHARNSEWWPEVAETESNTYPSAESAAKAETAQIKALKPRHNSASGKRYVLAMVERTELGQRLRVLRMRAGVSQERLARAAHVSYRTVNRIEAGQTKTVRELTIMALADALDVTTDELTED